VLNYTPFCKSLSPNSLLLFLSHILSFSSHPSLVILSLNLSIFMLDQLITQQQLFVIPTAIQQPFVAMTQLIRFSIYQLLF
jgi:hypothetical protein